jgi:hypothetical protein
VGRVIIMDPHDVDNFAFRPSFEDFIERDYRYGDALRTIINEARKVSEIKALETLIVQRGDERWELAVEDAVPGDDRWSVRLMGKARKLE